MGKQGWGGRNFKKLGYETINLFEISVFLRCSNKTH